MNKTAYDKKAMNETAYDKTKKSREQTNVIKKRQKLHIFAMKIFMSGTSVINEASGCLNCT